MSSIRQSLLVALLGCVDISEFWEICGEEQTLPKGPSESIKVT